MPLVCLSLTGKTIAENLAALDRYRGLIDIAELRADLLEPAELFALREFPARAGLPCILALRRKCDGGYYAEGEGSRLVILAKAISYASPDRSANYAYVDLESDFRVPAVEEACHTFGTTIIRSLHDVSGVPEDLDATWADLALEPGEIPKLAVTPKSAADLARLVSWASSLSPGRRIIVGMGEYGLPSRVLAERVGSTIAYTSALRAGMLGAAPGHLDPAVLEENYRFRQLTRETTFYALGGRPIVLASRSPQLHNAAFKASKLDAVVAPLPANNARELLIALDAMRARGAALSIPLKEGILPFLARKSPEVEDIGACNTIVREAEGWVGYNTDAQGFERAILEFMGRPSLAGLKATLIGAGGLAKAVAHVLAGQGVEVLVLNRTVSRARELARRYGFSYGPCTERSAEPVASHADLIVQATSVGMEGEEAGDPIDWYEFSGREAVYDLVYRPERTVLLARAEAANCRVANGWRMLRYQAAGQYKLWTGLEPPPSYFE
jgi:Shikimate 5-dehydrogenase